MKLPQVEKILQHPTLEALTDRFRRDLLVELVRDQLTDIRKTAEHSSAAESPSIESIAAMVAAQATKLLNPALDKVINGTGVVLNTNLGRAPISPTALEALTTVGDGYCNLEIDLVTGKRGQRSQRIQRLLRLLTGAESGLVVNNNAAAVLLCVNALARGKEVVVSRGELVEIGGSFRVPDVIESAGGILKEVGTTNRTRIGDFRSAISDRTGLLMRCHRSNFEISGFTEEVPLAQLVSLSEETGVPFLEDLGSGVLVDLSSTGLKDEPTARAVASSGCGLVAFSGDKLLGGPQAGIIVGKRVLIERLSKHPLYRALRLDKLTLALLERTLACYLSPKPEESIPVLKMLSTPASDIKQRAEHFIRTIGGTMKKISCELIETKAAAGGGSLPGESMPSCGIALHAGKLKPNKMSDLLRSAQPPIISIVHDDKVIIDFRTISASDEQLLAKAITHLDSQI